MLLVTRGYGTGATTFLVTLRGYSVQPLIAVPARTMTMPAQTRLWVVPAREARVVLMHANTRVLPWTTEGGDVQTFFHDPNDLLDYYVDWSGQLSADGGDTIDTSTWSADLDEATLTLTTEHAGITQVWIQVPSTARGAVRVRNHIVTTAGREYDGTLVLRLEQR